MKAGARLGAAGALILTLGSGCEASVNADAKVGGEGAKAQAQAEMSSDGRREGQGEMTLSAREPDSQAASRSRMASSPNGRRVLLGARHDLKLDPGKGTTSCECLAVALGGARDAGMSWSSEPPELDGATQLSIALSSEGQACKSQPKDSLGASYWGYRVSGNDVVVLVESAQSGRPLTTGAIVPKPVGTGQVFVAPASRRLPYGRGPEGKPRCKVGNPGEARTAPFNELEIGSDAPRALSGEVTESPRGDMQRAQDLPTTLDLPSN